MDFEVTIVGSGFSGIAMAIALQQAGICSFVLIEKGDDVGGTWRENRYPGCACDVPSHLYSFSFAPNPSWSRMYSPQSEIWDYARRVTEQFQLRKHIRFNTAIAEARFEESSGTWLIETSNGATIRSRVLVSAMGALSRPSRPTIPGIETFKGTSFHSQQWNHNIDLAGKNVAVIGTGASAIQIVPKIAQKVKSLQLFQRTPPWIIPRLDRSISNFEQHLFRWLTFTQRLNRWWIYWKLEIRVLGFTFEPALLLASEKLAQHHLARQIVDKALRKRVTPDYRLGCKRVPLSDDYYPALTRPNVELVTDPIRTFTPTGVVTENGIERNVDVLIFATGFHVTDNFLSNSIRGKGGRELSDAWRDKAEAYFGVATTGFPNLFLLVGPNSGLGHNSIIFMIEAQANYILSAIQELRRSGVKSLNVRSDVLRTFNDGIQASLRKAIWGSGCRGWYLDHNGRNTTIWPGYTWKFRQLTRRFNSADYEME